jgi:hypothetical protein
MLLFWLEEYVEKWCGNWNLPRGEAFSLDQCWRLAKAWYGPARRESDWRRRAVDETQALFTELGLTSPFWRLSR